MDQYTPVPSRLIDTFEDHVVLYSYSANLSTLLLVCCTYSNLKIDF